MDDNSEDIEDSRLIPIIKDSTTDRPDADQMFEKVSAEYETEKNLEALHVDELKGIRKLKNSGKVVASLGSIGSSIDFLLDGRIDESLFPLAIFTGLLVYATYKLRECGFLKYYAPDLKPKPL